MKKLQTIILITLFTAPAWAQPAPEKEVFEARSIVFYGYDFSLFHYADAKRYGQDLKTYIFTLIGSIQGKVTNDKLKGWLNKDNILFDFDHTTALNKTISNNDVIVTIEKLIPGDSLQAHLKRYSTTQKNGIGHVIVFESFDDLRGKLSAYSLFFDIETKKILLSSWGAFSDIGHIRSFGQLKPYAINMVEYLDKEVYKAKKYLLKQ